MKRNQILEERWKKINQELAGMGCPIGLPKIRPYQDGANEILGIVEVYRKSEPFFWVITFEYLKPFTGERGLWTMKFSQGMVVIPVIDGQLLLKRQHRPTIGKWTWEFPRSFTNLLASAEEVKNNPLGMVAEILKEEVGSVFEGSPTISEIHLIDNSAEDSGMSAVVNSIYVVFIKGCKLIEDGSKKKPITLKLFSLKEARQIVCEDHSKSALLSLINKILDEGFGLGG